eukprot:2085511-Rhodomonas_salina.2
MGGDDVGRLPAATHADALSRTEVTRRAVESCSNMAKQRSNAAQRRPLSAHRQRSIPPVP